MQGNPQLQTNYMYMQSGYISLEIIKSMSQNKENACACGSVYI